MKIRIYYEDTDLGGVVYHSKYLNFCERARSELFFSQGKTPVYEGHHFVVKSLEANYYEPALLGDLLEVATEVEELKRVSVKLRQSIYKRQRKIFELFVTLVCVKEGRPVKIPRYFLDVLAQTP
jgi:acyl-CoA thioester hydrolase